jgi:hypothetical protein
MTEPGIIKRNLNEKDIDDLEKVYINEKFDNINYERINNDKDKDKDKDKDNEYININNNNNLEVENNINKNKNDNSDFNISFNENNLNHFMPSILRYFL